MQIKRNHNEFHIKFLHCCQTKSTRERTTAIARAGDRKDETNWEKYKNDVDEHSDVNESERERKKEEKRRTNRLLCGVLWLHEFVPAAILSLSVLFRRQPQTLFSFYIFWKILSANATEDAFMCTGMACVSVCAAPFTTETQGERVELSDWSARQSRYLLSHFSLINSECKSILWPINMTVMCQRTLLPMHRPTQQRQHIISCSRPLSLAAFWTNWKFISVSTVALRSVDCHDSVCTHTRRQVDAMFDHKIM